MRVRILGKYWWFRFAPNMADNGQCDAPTKTSKEIRVSSVLRGEKLLATVIHELLHAANWHADEEWVQEASDDIARVIMKPEILERITDG